MRKKEKEREKKRNEETERDNTRHDETTRDNHDYTRQLRLVRENHC